MTNDSTHLSTWVSAETKRRFAMAAQRANLSESALMKKLIDDALFLSGDEVPTDAAVSDRPTRDARLTIRLEPEDRMMLRERAGARGMPSATYISVLVRSHLRNLAPLPHDELATLKRIVGSLDSVGRNLNKIAHAANQGVRVVPPGKDYAELMLKICTALRDHVQMLVRKNVTSWQVGHDEENR